ncbi:phi13 family phage major tail protein [Paenibacillus mucilaginosus]|uniref:major tail protein n=1 Tax=Paenibacillus mucilaginosus TaxID=61624 RepID=UPI003D20151F
MSGGVRIGLKDLHIAKLLSDDIAGAVYSVPKKYSGVISAKITPSSTTETLYADDGAAETATALGEITVEINLKDLTLDQQAELLGGTIIDGILVKKDSDTAPYVAVAFRSKKSNGKYRFKWLLKGRFSLPAEEYKTQGDKPEFQTPVISGVFVKREFDGWWEVTGDEDMPGFTLADVWFNKVYALGDKGGSGSASGVPVFITPNQVVIQ